MATGSSSGTNHSGGETSSMKCSPGVGLKLCNPKDAWSVWFVLVFKIRTKLTVQLVSCFNVTSDLNLFSVDLFSLYVKPQSGLNMLE